MALKNQTSFSAGELDPILHDRVTLERFQSALATARNVSISKSGTIMSRFGKFFFKESMYDNDLNIKIYSPPGSGLFLEFGLDLSSQTYANLYNFDGTLLHTFITSGSDHLYFSAANLDNLQFAYSGDYVYVFEGSNSVNSILRLKITSPYSVRAASQVLPSLLWPGGAPSVAWTVSGTGYQIDYAFSIVVNGEESEPTSISNVALKKPISVSEKNDLVLTIIAGASVPLEYDEVRIYQRPVGGAAFGYLGRTDNFYIDAGNVKAKFTDLGSDPDFGKGFVGDIVTETLNRNFSTGIIIPSTGTIYQQRLILGNVIGINEEAILASRPGFQTNFYKDFPYSADSALNFKAGTSGKAKVLRMVEADGLVIFTSNGVYVSTGILNPDNIALQKRGGWVIDERIAPLVIPGGLFFVDKNTSTVRHLVYSNEMNGYDSSDQSIFSDHLFKERTITSWAYQEGVVPLIIVVFSDGTFATYSYSIEHQMKAWTRHDGVWPVEQVEGTGIADTTIFVINKEGRRQIEITVPRRIPSSVYSVNPEADKLAYSAFMDGLKIKVDLRNDSLVGADEFVLTPVTPSVWDGNLTLTCGTSGLFPNTVDLGAVGSVFRFFHPVHKYFIDLTVASRNNNNSVVVIPSEEFPSEYATGFRMYLTHLTVTGLDHLDGEQVSIISDGNLVSSPYNDNDNDTYSILTVIAGEVDIVERSAITIVGRPIVADLKTLNISTAEQSPMTLESLNVNKMYIKTHESKGVFVDNYFPEEKVGEVDGHSVEEMQSLESYLIPSGYPLIANRSKPLSSRRHEITLPGSWDNQGQISIRQVDPFHFEILSIILDLEVLRRGR